MKIVYLIIIVTTVTLFLGCEKEEDPIKTNTTDEITIDSLTASAYTVKAWDTALIHCYATGENLVYSWECNHGTINGEGVQIRYAAGECCVGINTITCTVSNFTGYVVKEIQIEVTSYFGGGN